VIKCKKNNLTTYLNFGSYLKVNGSIKKDDEILYKISGSMDKTVHIKNAQNSKDSIEVGPKKVIKMNIPDTLDLKWNESRKLWYEVTNAILNGNNDEALHCKAKLEEIQREYLKKEIHIPQLFEKTNEIVNGVSIYKFKELNVNNN
jgi:hypothetical protein